MGLTVALVWAFDVTVAFASDPDRSRVPALTTDVDDPPPVPSPDPAGTPEPGDDTDTGDPTQDQPADPQEPPAPDTGTTGPTVDLPTAPTAATPVESAAVRCDVCEAAAAKATRCGSSKSRVAVLVVHGGGFATGSPADTHDTCRALGAAGFHAVNLPYPLLDLRAARRTVVEEAQRLRKRHRMVFAYGESAGGTLALLLAALSRIDRAYAWAPVSDLARWQAESVAGFVRWDAFPDSSPETLRALSPVTYATRRSSPVLVEHGRDDVHVPGAQSTRLQARWPAMSLRWVEGGHLPDSPGFLEATDNAVKYFRSNSRAKVARYRWR